MIEIDYQGDAAWITIDRPSKANAIDVEGWHELKSALIEAENRSRAIVLTGVRDYFSAGDDQSISRNLENADDIEEFGGLFADVLIEHIEGNQVPVIAAVNGYAYGAGLELIVAADLAVAVKDATFCLPETDIGGWPPFACRRIPQLGGRKQGMEAILLAEPFDAETAYEWGIVNRVVEQDRLRPTVKGFIDQVVDSPRRSIKYAKRAARPKGQDTNERDALIGGFAFRHLSEERHEGADSVVTDRDPEYK